MEDKLAAEHRATPARRHEPTVAAAPLSRARGTAGKDGVPIVVERPVFRIGIDKSKVSGDQAKASAVRLAKVVKINPRRTRRR